MTAYETLSKAPFSLCYWFKHMKIYKIIGIILLLLFLVPLITHYYLLTVSVCHFFVQAFIKTQNINRYQVESDGSSRDIYRTRSQLDAYEDFSSLRASDLKLRIDEMLRIKVRWI